MTQTISRTIIPADHPLNSVDWALRVNGSFVVGEHIVSLLLGKRNDTIHILTESQEATGTLVRWLGQTGVVAPPRGNYRGNARRDGKTVYFRDDYHPTVGTYVNFAANPIDRVAICRESDGLVMYTGAWFHEALGERLVGSINDRA